MGSEIVKGLFKGFLLLVGLIATLMVVAFIWIGSRGISAKAEPGRLETLVARTMRRLAIPRTARELQNPIANSPEIVAEGLAHYADHCAVCHANDGSGKTDIGIGLYPKPPDMRLAATQSLTDGELFYIIENGVRLTGMPAWSNATEEGKRSTWHLVHFMRELPKLTDDQIERMKALNPRSPEEIRQQIEEERFLSGAAEKPVPHSLPHKQ
jgi:mono/diheme cytochrome c family protein